MLVSVVHYGANEMLDIGGFLTSAEFLQPFASLVAQLVSGLIQMLLASLFVI